jgi:NitT/TauT family transport system substrate-binding protein
MRTTNLKHFTLAMATIASLTASVIPATAKDKVRVGFGTTWPTFSILQLAQEQKRLGDVEIEVTILDTPVRGYQMMSAGQLDVVFGTLDYVPIAASSNLPISLVSVVDISYGADEILLAPGVKPEDLKGKKIGAGQGFIGELYMGEFLKRHGLGTADVTWVNINPDEIVGPMVSGDVKAVYTYEPWSSKLAAALPGTQRALNSGDKDILANGTIADTVYMSNDFLAKHSDEAQTILRGFFDTVKARSEDTAKANDRLAEFTKWPLGDVAGLLGTSGRSAIGGMYIVDFDEAARQCGVLQGEGPLGQANGSLPSAVNTIEDGWINRGTLQIKAANLASYVNCEPLKALVKSGYRSSSAAQ